MGGASAGSGNAYLAAFELRIGQRWMTQEHEEREVRVLRNASVTVTEAKTAAAAASQSALTATTGELAGAFQWWTAWGRTDLEAC